MSTNKILLLVLSIITISCQPDNSLDLGDLSAPPKYFVECFCKPGDFYQLTATKVTPMADDFIWDLSIPFRTYITDLNTHKLNQGVFYNPYSNFVYNYASPQKVPIDFTDTLYLKIISPEGDTIIGKTQVISQIKINNYSLKDNTIELSFNIDTSPEKRYYTLRIENWKEGKIISTVKLFTDFNTSTKTSETLAIVNNIEEYKSVNELDSIRIKLFHITKENYDYMTSLNEAIKSNEDSMTQPAPIKGNLDGSLGIFTYYTEDIVTYIPSKK